MTKLEELKAASETAARAAVAWDATEHDLVAYYAAWAAYYAELEKKHEEKSND
jgi:hypothetical protein